MFSGTNLTLKSDVDQGKVQDLYYYSTPHYKTDSDITWYCGSQIALP